MTTLNDGLEICDLTLTDTTKAAVRKAFIWGYPLVIADLDIKQAFDYLVHLVLDQVNVARGVSLDVRIAALMYYFGKEGLAKNQWDGGDGQIQLRKRRQTRRSQNTRRVQRPNQTALCTRHQKMEHGTDRVQDAKRRIRRFGYRNCHQLDHLC